MIKEGSIVKYKYKEVMPLSMYSPKWTRGKMIYKRCVKNGKGAKTNHVGKFVCYKMDLSDYVFISECELKVVREPFTQLSLFD